MGEAKRRGTFEERVAQSKERHDKEYRDAQEAHERRTKLMAERRTPGTGMRGVMMAAAAAISCGGTPLRGNPAAGGIVDG